jgi:predicted nucleic acid-binding protein
MAKAIILVDSCFWIAYFSPQETERHLRAISIIEYFENNEVLIPWPTLYEFINTKLARRKENLFAFEQFLLKPNVFPISDLQYKEKSLSNVFELNITHHNSISLVDEIIRQMICDRDLRINFLATFNRKDFEYECQIGGIEILE